MHHMEPQQTNNKKTKNKTMLEQKIWLESYFMKVILRNQEV